MAVTHPPSGFGGSTPSRRTDNMARSSSGRMRDPHSRGMGSSPVRVTKLAKWWNGRHATLRTSCRMRRGGSNLPLVTDRYCRCGRCPAGFHTAGPPGSIPGPATAASAALCLRQQKLLEEQESRSRVGQCSSGFHMPRPSGATPEPATAGYANWQSGEVESLVTLWVRLPPRSLRLVPWSNGDDTCVTCRRRWFNSIRDH